jgi:hypothetical protein
MRDLRLLNVGEYRQHIPRKVPVPGIGIESTWPRWRITALRRSNRDGQRRYNTDRADEDLSATASMGSARAGLDG